MLGRREPGGSTGIFRHTGSEARLEVVVDLVNQFAQMIGRVDPQIRHAAVPDPAVLNNLEPVHSPMADANPVHVGRFGDHYEIGAVAMDQPARGQAGNAREAAAFFVDGPALLDGTRQALRRLGESLRPHRSKPQCPPSGRLCRGHKAFRPVAVRRTARQSSPRPREPHQSGH